MIGLGILYRTNAQFGPNDENQEYGISPEFQKFVRNYMDNMRECMDKDEFFLDELEKKDVLQLIHTQTTGDPVLDDGRHFILNTIMLALNAYRPELPVDYQFLAIVKVIFAMKFEGNRTIRK
jgi:hypothetical protein